MTRKVRAHTQKFHNQHRRPGHDGAGYPDFRISSDDSDNEHRIIVNQKSKSLAGGETGLPSRQMGSEPGWNQVKIARFFSMVILKSFYQSHKKPIVNRQHSLQTGTSAFDGHGRPVYIKPDRLATIRRESLEERLPLPRHAVYSPRQYSKYFFPDFSNKHKSGASLCSCFYVVKTFKI